MRYALNKNDTCAIVARYKYEHVPTTYKKCNDIARFFFSVKYKTVIDTILHAVDYELNNDDKKELNTMKLALNIFDDSLKKYIAH